jgi:hypothetical protein
MNHMKTFRPQRSYDRGISLKAINIMRTLPTMPSKMSSMESFLIGMSSGGRGTWRCNSSTINRTKYTLPLRIDDHSAQWKLITKMLSIANVHIPTLRQNTSGATEDVRLVIFSKKVLRSFIK